MATPRDVYECCSARSTFLRARKRRAHCAGNPQMPSRCHVEPSLELGRTARGAGARTGRDRSGGSCGSRNRRVERRGFFDDHLQDLAHALWGWGACGSGVAMESEVLIGAEDGRAGRVLPGILGKPMRVGTAMATARPPLGADALQARAGFPIRTCALARAPRRTLCRLVAVDYASCARSSPRTSRTSRGASRRRWCRNLSC